MKIFESFLTSNLCPFTRKESKDASENNNYYTCYNEDFVTQHDPLRKLAIYESSQEPIGQRKRLIMDINKSTLREWCTKQDQHLSNARLLSISISTGWFILLLSHAHKCTHMHECIHMCEHSHACMCKDLYI